MSDPMYTDQIRTRHQSREYVNMEGRFAACMLCKGIWPCDAVRLVEIIEVMREADEQWHDTYNKGWTSALTRAETAEARLAVLQARLDAVIALAEEPDDYTTFSDILRAAHGHDPRNE